MKKVISLLSAFALSTAFLLPQDLSVSAVTVSDTMDTMPYTIRMVPERTAVSEEELAAGDVTIPVKIYLCGSTANRIASVKLQYESSSDQLYFTNMKYSATRNETEQVYSYSGGSFSTKYEPYCFGEVDSSNNRYTHNTSLCANNQYACDPIFGSALTSTGDGRIQFTGKYFEGIDTNNDGVLERDTKKGEITKTFVCDVTVDENGNGSYTFEYIDQTTYLPTTITQTIPRYDKTLPEGSRIPDACNSISWIVTQSSITVGAAFLGNASDEFPFMQVDVVIKQGTPCGIYDLDFKTNIDSTANSAGCELHSGSNNKYKQFPIELRGASIGVGVDSVDVLSTQQDSTAIYAAHDTYPIQATDFAKSVLANVTFTDGTTAQEADITRLVTCEDQKTPSDLFQENKKNNAYSEDVPLYCLGKPLTSSNVPIRQHILIGTKGDVDYDGTVTLDDAFQVLTYYSKKAAGNTNAKLYNGDAENAEEMELLSYFLADIDTSSKTTGSGNGEELNLDDAFDILQYYSYHAAGKNVTWDQFIK